MRAIVVIQLGLLLAGCATSYQSSSWTGGFTETRLADDVYKVSFTGNGFTSSERAEDMAMLRSAELTKQSGYTYFALADAKSTTTTTSYTEPTQSYTTGQATAIGNTAYGSAQTTTYGGGTTYIHKPKASNLVVMFHEKPNMPGLIFEASYVCASIGPKYKVTC